ncbi:MAG: ankyrin repeat domain-containing protein [Bacteroidota bacterium]
MNYLHKLIEQIELHAVDGIKDCFAHGISPNDLYRNEPLIYELTSEYTRTSRFKDCVKVFVDHGLKLDDEVLLSVLLNDADTLDRLLTHDPKAVVKKYTLRCAYTPLYEAPLLHICAEFNHAACAEVLVKHGAAINAKAGMDENGFGGQTAIFHTVNQNSDQSAEMMNFLLSHAADLAITVRGLIWGKGYEWETLIPSVNPVSYAMMGLLPQMHRNEVTISKVVTVLLNHAYGIDYTPGNVPNAYLK